MSETKCIICGMPVFEDKCLYELNKINEITVVAAMEAGRAAVRARAKEMKKQHEGKP